MNKTLKFDSELVPMILSGEKTSTWRLWDDKDLSEGDVVDFLGRPDLHHFFTAKLTKVIKKPFAQLTEEDKKSHGSYQSDALMYEFFSKAYGRPVDENTVVTIIWFKPYDK
jgi:hypothetical protein